MSRNWGSFYNLILASFSIQHNAQQIIQQDILNLININLHDLTIMQVFSYHIRDLYVNMNVHRRKRKKFIVFINFFSKYKSQFSLCVNIHPYNVHVYFSDALLDVQYQPEDEHDVECQPQDKSDLTIRHSISLTRQQTK